MARLHESAACLRIFGDALDPDEVTRLLAARPTLARRKGDKIISKSGERVAKTGQWHLEAKSRIPADIDGQITEVLGGLSQDLSVWRDLSGRFEIDFFLGLFMNRGGEGTEISSTTMKSLGDRGIKLGFDIYSPTLEQLQEQYDEAKRADEQP